MITHVIRIGFVSHSVCKIYQQYKQTSVDFLSPGYHYLKCGSSLGNICAIIGSIILDLLM